MKMKLTFISLFIGIFILSCSDDGSSPEVSGFLDKAEAQEAFNYLNNIRQNPGAYSNEIGVDLSYVEPRHKLVWNSICAQVAEEKALDMIKRDYFGHVDPDGYGINRRLHDAGYEMSENFIQNKSDASFESISQWGDGKYPLNNFDTVGIKCLIVDEGWDPPGHRNHLLGIIDFWEDCIDCGIGIAYSDDKTYARMCVIIAKHGKATGEIGIIL